MTDRVAAVMDARDIGMRSYAKTRQNLALAFVFNGIGVPATATGFVHPIWAMAAMVASVTAVLANSFAGRLLRRARGEQPADPTGLVERQHRREHDGQEVGTIRPAAREPGHERHRHRPAAGTQRGRGPSGQLLDHRGNRDRGPEASDTEVAEQLTEMMGGGSPVLVVPRLADVPVESRDEVFVFTNGIDGMGSRRPMWWSTCPC